MPEVASSSLVGPANHPKDAYLFRGRPLLAKRVRGLGNFWNTGGTWGGVYILDSDCRRPHLNPVDSLAFPC